MSVEMHPEHASVSEIFKYETLLVAIQDGVGLLELNRPDSRNALNEPMAVELLDALTLLARSGSVRSVLITGAGRGFCSGADLKGEMREVHDWDAGRSLETHFNPIIELLIDMPKPVIAAVNGAAAGAGCSLALAADITLAGSSAFFVQAFATVGLVPDLGATWVLPRHIGRARAMAMMMLGERISAETAENWGMIWKSVPDADLQSTALAMARRLASGPTLAYALIRRGVRRALETTLSDTLREERLSQGDAGRSRDFAEGLEAFVERRSPNFMGD